MSMSRSSALLVLLIYASALATPAFAAEADPLAKVEALKQAVADPDGTWEQRWRAYLDMKACLKAAKGPAKQQAEAAYKLIQKDVANAIRRNELPVSGWLMGFFGATLMWGGLAFCIGVARKKGNSGGRGAS